MRLVSSFSHAAPRWLTRNFPLFLCRISNDEKVLKDERTRPHIVVGTPGRIQALCSPEKASARSLDLSKVKHFVLDECDKMLESLGMPCSHRRTLAIC